MPSPFKANGGAAMQVGRAFFARSVATTFVCLLAACAGAPQVEPPVALSANADQLKAKGRGVIVVSGVVQLEALWTTHPKLDMTFAALKPDGQPDFLASVAVAGHDDPAKPFVGEVAAGEYILAAFSYPAHGGKYTSAAGLLGAAPARFKIAAGEVLYLGHLKVLPEKSIVVEAKPKFVLKLESYEVAARGFVATRQSTLAPLLRSQPLSLAPQLAITQ
jgi:hypothetical protein